MSKKNRCTHSPGGKHEPEDVEVTGSDAAGVEVTFTCEWCGCEGTMKVKRSAVSWAAEEDDFTGEEDLLTVAGMS